MDDKYPKPFKEVVSQSVEDLVNSDPEAVHPSNGDINFTVQESESGGTNNVIPNSAINPPQDNSENDTERDFEGSISSEHRQLNQMQDLDRPGDRSVLQMNTGRRIALKLTIIKLCIMIIFLLLTVSFWIGFGIKYNIKPPLEVFGEFTRTGTYTLLTAFPCSKTSCDVLEVDINAIPSTKPDQVNYFLSDCSNIVYGHFEQKDNVSSTYYANTPEPIITEDYLSQNYFSGQLSILMHATPHQPSFDSEDDVPPKTEVYLCHFVDPFKFDQFLHSHTHWKEYMKGSTCKRIDIDAATNYSNSVTFNIMLPAFSFVGAVLTSNYYTIQFGYSIVGRGIVDINDTQKCSLNIENAPPSHCSIPVNKLATGSQKMCVLGEGVSENDGHFLYTKAAVSLKYKSQMKFQITMIICSIIFVILFILILDVIVAVCYLWRSHTAQMSTQEAEIGEHCGSYEQVDRNQYVHI